MALSPYSLEKSLSLFSAIIVGTAYQNSARPSATITSNATNVFTMTSGSVAIVPGMAVTILSANLPGIFVGRDVIFIGPTTPAVAGQFNCYLTMADALAGINKMTSATSWSGTMLDLDLDRQFSRQALLTYESTFTGYARTFHNFSTGSVPSEGQLVRTCPLSLSNTGTVAAQISHVIAFDQYAMDVAGVARLASVTTLQPATTQAISVQLSAVSV